MLSRRTLTVSALLLAGFALNIARALDVPPMSDISTLVLRQPYGMRDQVVPLIAKLENTGQPLPNRIVHFYERSNRYSSREYASGVTDADGYCRVMYRIPKQDIDDIYVKAVFKANEGLPPGTVSIISGATSEEKRIQIGRPYP